MKNIFEIAAFCLHHGDITRKIAATRQAGELMQADLLDFRSLSEALAISQTRFPQKPSLQDPKTMPRRKFTTVAGQKAFFHAIAHIEFVAIYLAWDMIYRFRGLPEDFYRDWLQVASEEALHFSMIQQHMQALGISYGDLPAHSGLWDVAEDSSDCVLARLALVPRYMEAHGLDVTPGMIDKLQKMQDDNSVALLQRILEDEVGHVAIGSKWFAIFCTERDLAAEEYYQYLISTRLKGTPRGNINRPLRLQAGFSESELDWLENTYRCKTH